MDDNSERTDTVAKEPPGWDRFASWPALPARLLLLALALILTAAALAPIRAGDNAVRPAGFAETGTGAQRARDDDLALYDRAIERIQHGENYYDFIVAEQRQADYPVRPGLAVRLPTLAYLDAWLGAPGQIAAAFALLAAVMLAWWRRLGEEPGGRRHRTLAMALLFVGASLGLNRYFFTLHELWAGMLMALAFGLHRPGKWGGALAAAALAVAIREHALPFVLLMGALAAMRRDWQEAAAWTALTMLFLAGLAWHLHIIASQVTAADPLSASWLALRGLGGWLSNVVLSSNLRYLPTWLAGPTVMLAVFGWASWRSPAGLFGTLLFLGYGALFMVAGRADNYYWGAVIAPAMLIGLAFVPRGLASLVEAAAGRPQDAPLAAAK